MQNDTFRDLQAAQAEQAQAEQAQAEQAQAEQAQADMIIKKYKSN